MEIMAKEIVVALKRKDQVEEIIPYIEKVAQPGMAVVFLVPVVSGGFKEFTNQLLAIHTGIRPALLPGNGGGALRREEIRSAEGQILPHCKALRKKGIGLGVSGYAGTLWTVVRGLAEKEEVHLVMIGPRRPSLAIRLLRKAGSFFHAFKSYGPPPVLLVNPSSIVGRSR
jgi:hypothetical protein